MRPLRGLLARLRLRSLDRGEYSSAAERPLDNPDGLATAGFPGLESSGYVGDGLVPPGYVKSYDEGRPRK